MLGASELMRQTPLSDEQKEYVGILEDSGEVLMRLVNELLDFSRIEAGKMKLEIKHFDPASLLSKMVHPIFARRRIRKQETQAPFESAAWEFLAFASRRSRQAFTSNSLKFDWKCGQIYGSGPGAVVSAMTVQEDTMTRGPSSGFPFKTRARAFLKKSKNYFSNRFLKLTVPTRAGSTVRVPGWGWRSLSSWWNKWGEPLVSNSELPWRGIHVLVYIDL